MNKKEIQLAVLTRLDNSPKLSEMFLLGYIQNISSKVNMTQTYFRTSIMEPMVALDIVRIVTDSTVREYIINK